MRTTVDIPDQMYRELKTRAASEGTTVKALILRGVTHTLQPVSPPKKRPRPRQQIIRTGQPPGSLKLTNVMINELLYS